MEHSSEKDAGQAEAIEIDWEALARASVHPLQISVLEILGLDGGRALSPNEMRHELQLPLSNTTYHVAALVGKGLVELAGARGVRGVTEHFYRLTPPRR